MWGGDDGRQKTLQAGVLEMPWHSGQPITRVGSGPVAKRGDGFALTSEYSQRRPV